MDRVSGIRLTLGTAGRRSLQTTGLTVLLGALVAVASWSVHFVPPGPGIDQSWIGGLMMASRNGMDFGTQIVFTWGPLAFLRQPFLYFDGLAALGFVYSGAILFAAGASLVWSARRPFGLAIAVLASFAVLAGLPFANLPPILAALWCLAALRPEPSVVARPVVIYGLAAWGAIECLTRLSSGPLILLIAFITLLALPSRKRDLPIFAGVALSTFVVAWFAAGQGVGNFPDFIHRSLEVVGGYSWAMVLAFAPAWWITMAIVASVVLIAMAALGGRDLVSRIVAGLVMAIVAFSVFKESVVRYEAAHAAALFATLAGLALAIQWRRRAWPLALGTATLVGWLAIQSMPTYRAEWIDPINHAESFATEVETLLSPGRQREMSQFGRETMIETYRLDRRTRELLRGQRVQVEPWETGIAWAYDLDWDPAPSFQNYVAYTSGLDQQNAEKLVASDGPTRILRENMGEPDATSPWLSVDARFPSWDPPAQNLAMLCNFVPLHTTRRFQVLARGPDRCGAEKPIESVRVPWGAEVKVPAAPPGALVLARIHGAESGTAEKLRAAVFRAHPTFLVTNGAAYRMIQKTAEDGLIMSIPPRADLPGPAFRLSPEAHVISPQGGSGNVTIDFYSMPIKPLQPSP